MDDRTLGSRDEYVLDRTLPEHGDLGAKQGTWGAAREAPLGQGWGRQSGGQVLTGVLEQEGEDWDWTQVRGLLRSFPPSGTASPSQSHF